MISTFNASRTTRGDTTQRNSDWNGDASTLGAQCEEHEYGAGDPERVLALPTGLRSSLKRWTREEVKEEEKKKLAQIATISQPPPNMTMHPRALPPDFGTPF
jgi:hypothetical protein